MSENSDYKWLEAESFENSSSSNEAGSQTRHQEPARIWHGMVLGVELSDGSSIDPEIVKNILDEMCEKYVFQMEKSPEGYLHLQCVIGLKSKKRKSALLKFFAETLNISKENVQIRKVKNKVSAMKYCSKEETRMSGPWLKGVEIEKGLKLLKYENMYEWQKKIVDECSEECTDDRTINWIWEREGCVGKTQLCKYMAVRMNAMIVKGNPDSVGSRIILEKRRPTICILNLPRSKEGWCISQYETLESVKDGLICSSKYEGGQVIFDSPHVYVFANWPPDESKLSSDRWNVVQLPSDS